jgi:hypothetical protein
LNVANSYTREVLRKLLAEAKIYRVGKGCVLLLPHGKKMKLGNNQTFC